MSYSINQLKSKAIPLPITQEALMIARTFANSQPTESKWSEVYFNTLAVCLVNNYMEMMQIPTDLKSSDICNPLFRLCENVADLKLSGLGHLECRPVKPISLSEQVTVLCELPEEMPSDRIGCIIVEIDQSARSANLLGFVKNINMSSGELSSTQLFYMDEFVEYVEELREKPTSKASSPVPLLRQWFENTFESSWQPIEALLTRRSSDLAFRSAVTSDVLSNIGRVGRAKLIELASQLITESLILVIELMPPQNNSEIEIIVKVYPATGQIYLPPGLQIMMVDEAGVVKMAAQSSSNTPWIQFEFSCFPSESFSVQFVLSDIEVNEQVIV
jgi:hypothetical protein